MTSGASADEVAALEADAAEITGQRNTLFKGETLRGLLLSAFAWSTVGSIAGIAAWAAFAAGAAMFVLVMLGLTIFNYFSAIAIGDASGKPRTALFAAAISVNIAVLGAFKYAGFAVGTLNAAAGAALPVPEIELPLGISFFTFHCMSYLIDIFRRQFAPNRKFSEMAL